MFKFCAATSTPPLFWANKNKISTATTGPNDAIPSIPKVSLLDFVLLNLDDIPEAIASKNGAEIIPVVAPPASKARAIYSLLTKQHSKKINAKIAK